MNQADLRLLRRASLLTLAALVLAAPDGPDFLWGAVVGVARWLSGSR
jgi:hypothetical protein